MGYNQLFGGSAVYPSNQTYTAITLSVDTPLAWPIESVSSNTIIADLMDITPINQSGWNLTLPDATGGSNGITMILNNVNQTYSFNLQDNAANLVVSIAPGTVWLVYLVDNSTIPGVWRAFQYGAQSGSVNVAAIAGSGLLAIGTSLNQSMPVSGKGTNYTAVDGDRATVILWTGAAGVLTLPAPSAVGSNWFINVRNSGTGDLAVTPTSGLIDGSSSKTFTSGVGSAIVFTDGTNYYTLGYGTAGSTSGFDYTTINCAGSDGVNGVITLAGGQLNRISYKCFGILTGPRTIIVPTTVQQYWINNQTTSSGGPWALTIKTLSGGGQTISQPGQAIIYCDGTDVQPGQSGISLPVPIASGGTGATTAAAARTALGSSATGDSLFTAASAAAARTVLGAGTVGGNVFVSVTADAALTAMAGGTMTGGFTTTGSVAVGGNLNVTGQAIVAGVNVISATVPLNGMYTLGSNRLAFSTNTTLAGYFDSSQQLTLIHALALTQGGTGGTTAATARTGIGLTAMDATGVASQIVQRDASARLSSAAVQEAVTIGAGGAILVENSAADNLIRKISMAGFRTQFDVGQYTAANPGYQNFASGLTVQFGSIAVNSSTFSTVNFAVAFGSTVYSVVIAGTAGNTAQSRDYVSNITTSNFRINNSSTVLTTFYWMAIGN